MATLDFAGETRFWVGRSYVGNFVHYFYAHTKPTTNGYVSVLYRDRDETFWTLFDHDELFVRLYAIFEYVELNTCQLRTPIRVDMFKTDEGWLVNEIDVFGSGELLSSSEDALTIDELALMADNTEDNILSWIY